MRYVGSKGKLIKHLKPYLEEYLGNNHYIEPFVGGGNAIVHINHHSKFGYDVEKYAIALLNHCSNGGDLPDVVTEDEYTMVKNNKDDYPDWYVGFCAYCCSFGGKFFGGYARDDKGTNYASQQARSLKKSFSNTSKINFAVSSYEDVDVGHGNVIYCDPPYQDTLGYKSGKFDHDAFWDWARIQSTINYVYVSEFTAPDDFISIWQKERVSTVDLNTGGKNL